MNIKLRLGEVERLFDKLIPIDKVSLQLKPIAQQHNLVFADFQVGGGYYQWSLPGAWTSFADASDAEKSVVAAAFKDRKAAMQAALGTLPLKDVVFTVPSEKFIYFRDNGGQVEIALTAWGFKYPNRPAGGELDTFISKDNVQQVTIAFTWDEVRLPGFGFRLVGQPRTTSQDGTFYVGSLSVGKALSVQTLTGQSYDLLVEKGRDMYVYDLTQRFNVAVEVKQNGAPMAGQQCTVDFDSHSYTLETDASGRATTQVPLAGNGSGLAVMPQPQCSVTCNSETQQQEPARDGDTLTYVFDFKTATPPPPPPPPPPVDKKTARVEVKVTRGGKPVEGQQCSVSFGDQSYNLVTDAAGAASCSIVLAADEQGILTTPQPECAVACDSSQQQKTPTDEGEVLHFAFALPEEQQPEPEPEYVYIVLNDYGGVPMPDLKFFLTTKKKGEQQLVTDSEGRCKVPKDWFTAKEKMKVRMVIDADYQLCHDLHDKKKKQQKQSPTNGK